MTESYATNRWVYLDNNATTCMNGRVVGAMLPFFQETFANPSSMHGLGSASAAAVARSREQIRLLIGANRASELVFTSGGSEANNTAIRSALATQAGRDEIVTSAVEHPSVLALCAHLEKTGIAKVHRIPVDPNGTMDLDSYRRSLNARTALVSIQWANNETGVISPIEVMSRIAHEAGALFHCDAVQAAGRVPIQVCEAGIDMLSLSAHKMHGPKGIGLLFLRHGVRIDPLILGGRQERGRRAGTENTPAIVGFGMAAELAAHSMSHDSAFVSRLRDTLEAEILRLVPGSMVIGSRANRLPNTLNMAFEDIEADSILLQMDRACIAVSSGSACSSGSMEPSHVLRAMKVPFSHLRGAVRFSLSRDNSNRDIERVIEVLPRVIDELRTQSVSLEAAYD